MIDDAEDWPPEGKETRPGDNGQDEKTLEDFCAEAGIDEITQKSTHEEVVAAVKKFAKITERKDNTWIAAAQGSLAKKLTGANIKAAGDIVKAALKRQGKSKDLSGKGLIFSKPEPWPDKVNGEELSNEICDLLNLHIILPPGADVAITLWILFSWTHDAFCISPLLDFSSPVRRCGKTTALRILMRLVPEPLPVVNIKTATLFRSIEAFSPTLLIDEVDTFLNRDPEMNGVLNGGHEREFATVARCEGENNEPRKYSIWCPKVLSGIGRRKETLRDRSIAIPMKRKAPGQKVEKLPLRPGGKFLILRRKLARWAKDHLEELRESEPSTPDSLNDRAQDNWNPPFSIADLCGEEWTKKAREAALVLSSDDNQDDDTWGIQLLSDIRDYFIEEDIDRVSSEDIVKHLQKIEDRDWSEMGKSGKPITKSGLSRILRPFNVKPRTVRPKGETITFRGYRREWFKDAFLHYLPKAPSPSDTATQTIKNKDLDGFLPDTNPLCVSGKNQDNLFNNNGVLGVSDGLGGGDEKEENKEDYEDVVEI